MNLKDRIIVITGAASGIGRAMARRFAAEGPKLIVCADRDEAGARATAAEVGGVAFARRMVVAPREGGLPARRVGRSGRRHQG